MANPEAHELEWWFELFKRVVAEEWREFMASKGYELASSFRDSDLLAVYYRKDDCMVEISVPIRERIVVVRFIRFRLESDVDERALNQLFLSPHVYLSTVLVERNVVDPEIKDGKFDMGAVAIKDEISLRTAVRRMRELTSQYATDLIDLGIKPVTRDA